MNDPTPSTPPPYPLPAGTGPGVPPGWPGGPSPAPGAPRRSPRGFFIAGGVLGIIGSANLFLMAVILQVIVRTEGLLGIVALGSAAGVLLAAFSCAGHRWAAAGSAGVQLVALLAVLALPFGGYHALAGLGRPPLLLLNGGGGQTAGLMAVILLGMLGLLQVSLSLLSAIFSLVACSRREGDR